MSVANDVSINGVPKSITKNTVLKDSSGSAVPFDYSGLIAGLSLTFGF